MRRYVYALDLYEKGNFHGLFSIMAQYLIVYDLLFTLYWEHVLGAQ